ncbi:MAG: hypothetical protein HOP03_01385 [Lysobacter sp.]|nr:hypothetical protein [Lysobacter sp.]
MKQSRRFLIKLALAVSAVLGGAAHATVEGYVDMHSHLMGEHAFGGSWFWGSTEGPMQSALARCDGNFGYPAGMGSHAATIFPGVSEILGKDTGWHLFRRRGYDNRRCRYFLWFPIPGTCPQEHFEDWPKWDAIAHQQMWFGHLQKAHANGLRVMGVSFAESNFLCQTTPPLRRRYDCDEMASIKRQALFLRGFVSRNSGWVGIAETPAQARSLIAQGKLALVMTAEVTRLFPDGDYIPQLNELHALGIRSLQLVHHADNRFAGTAPINNLRTAATLVEALTFGGINTRINDTVCRDGNGTIQIEGIPSSQWIMPIIYRPKCDGELHLNDQGLTQDGRGLVNAMIDRGMILDVSHLSRKSLQQTYGIAMGRGQYPLTYSHAHMWDMIEGAGHDEKNEKYIRADEIHMITDTGGMIGLRTGPEAANPYIRPPQSQPVVANSCKGSVRSFAQSLMYAVDRNINVGFGGDFNGFITQSKGVFTRFDRSPLGGSPFYLPVGCTEDYQQLLATNGFNDLHRKGLGHVGLLPEYIADLKRVGVPAQYMEHLEKRSAETYLRIWERSLALAGGGIPSNLALSATATASSTYCVGPPQTSPDCYAASRVNDGIGSTALGGQSSWANDWGVPMPQWVQLTWSAPVTASSVVVTTTAGYAVRDYDIEYWNGATWLPLAHRVGNTALGNTDNFAPVSTTRMRILGWQGPAHQPGHVRINEFAVY